MPSVWIRGDSSWVLAGSPVTPETNQPQSVAPMGLAGTVDTGNSDFSARANHVHTGAFTSLTDTPASFGTDGQIPAVNSAGTALEFIDAGEVGAEIPYNEDTDLPAPLGSALADGTDSEVARFDHVHTGTFEILTDTPDIGNNGQVLKVVSGALAFATDDNTPPRSFGSSATFVESTGSAGTQSTVSRSNHRHGITQATIDGIIDGSLGATSGTAVTSNRGIEVFYNTTDNEFYFEDRITTSTGDPSDSDGSEGDVYIRTD